jgi:hypothetical protein
LKGSDEICQLLLSRAGHLLNITKSIKYLNREDRITKTLLPLLSMKIAAERIPIEFGARVAAEFFQKPAYPIP